MGIDCGRILQCLKILSNGDADLAELFERRAIGDSLREMDQALSCGNRKFILWKAESLRGLAKDIQSLAQRKGLVFRSYNLEEVSVLFDGHILNKSEEYSFLSFCLNRFSLALICRYLNLRGHG